MARAPQNLSCALPLTASPTRKSDSTDADTPLRINSASELAIRDTPASYYGLCEAGELIYAHTATTGTGLTWVAAQTAFSDTTPNFYIFNNEVAGGRSLRLHYLKLIATQACTSGTAIHYVAIMDNVARALTTDNTQALTQVVPNGNVSTAIASPTIVGQNSASASVIAASSTAGKRRVARGIIGGLTIAGDVLSIGFGELIGGGMAQTAATGAGQPGHRVAMAPPVIIAPQTSLTIHLWIPSSSASINPEVELLLSAK